MPESSLLRNIFLFLPETLLLATGLLLLVLDSLLPKGKKSPLGGVAVGGVFASLLATFLLWNQNAFLFGTLYILDPYALFFKLIFLGTTLLTLLISFRYLALNELPRGEYYALILFATTGMMVMSAGMDLLSIYLGLEIMAISSYALVGFLKKERASLEGALKYFLLGAFNSGIILYGIALLYGASGTTRLSGLALFVEKSTLVVGERTLPNILSLGGVVLLVCGFAFKIAAFPFHMWAPDVYEGSPPPIAGFISVGSKAASFAALLRLFFFSLGPLKAEWQGLFVFLSMTTMTVGNLLAISQVNLKRMLAYSSIAHAGYLLIGLAVGTAFGVSGMLFYFVAYALMNLGAFAMIVLLAKENFRAESIEDFRGLAKQHPVWALCFLMFPPSAGFIGKFYLFAAAIQSGLYGLALVAVLNSVLALSYYFRVVRGMYMMEARFPLEASHDWGVRLSLILLALLTLLLGLYPVPILRTVQQAGASLL